MVDVVLIEKARKGDNEAFSELFNRYYQKILGTAYCILHDKQNAEDVAQETFIKVYAKINKLSSPQAFEVWIYRIAVNLCTSIFREANKSGEVQCTEQLDEIMQREINNIDTIGDSIADKEIYVIVMDSIRLLSEKHKVVLTLFYFNNMSLREIAEVLNSTEGTVKSRLFYAKKELRKLLLKQGISIDGEMKGEFRYEA